MTIVVIRRPNKITMEGSASSINSRATAIKTILLTAWRGKLSNEDWELRIRKVLPKGVNGDVYDLADCLLKQALVGPVPNQLFISYLKHAVKCELVSHSAVLSSISNQPLNFGSSNTLSQLNRNSPIICLLEFLKSFRDQISCRGTEIECLNLCRSLSELLRWLLKTVGQTLDCAANILMQQNVANLQANNPNNSSATAINSQLQTNNLFGILDLCTEMIHHFIDGPFTRSLLFISKIEFSKDFDENIIKTLQQIQQKLTNCQSLFMIQEKVPHLNILSQIIPTFNSRDLHPSIVAAHQLKSLQNHRIRSTQIHLSGNFEKRIQNLQSTQPSISYDSTLNYALFNSLYPLVAFDAVLRPARSNRYLARQIVTIANFNSAPINMTYCELIRICMIGYINAQGNSTAKASWSFFTFLKLPRLLIELNKQFKLMRIQSSSLDPPAPHSLEHTIQTINANQNHATNFINDLKLAFERICEYSPLLDEAEYKCNCDLFKCLVKELIKIDSSLAQLKNLDFRKFPARRQINLNNNNNSLGGHMMLKTEPVVTSMLETLNSKQDPAELFSILCQSCTGISFEYTLAAAAATGRLDLFVKRLVEHNELFKLPRDDLQPRNRLAHTLNFDITFLILIYIAQRYGPELIDRDQCATFNKWYYECYNPKTSFSCPKEMLRGSDPENVSSLIKQLASPDSDVQLMNVNWHDVCFNLPKAVSELLSAWEQGHLSDDDINIVIGRLRSRMCSLAVLAATWLQCYIKTLSEANKPKALFLLESLGNKASGQAKQQQRLTIAADLDLKDCYSERSSLLSYVIKRIYFELAPSRTPSSGSATANKNQRPSATGSSGGNSSSATGTMASSSAAADSDEAQNESAYHSYKDRFISTLSTQEIFLANVKQCLHRGWIDYDSLNSLNSLFAIIGSECFTNLLVEQILTSNESPSALSRAVNITLGLFHLDIEACAFALLKETIPSWLMGEKKQMLLNQPRAFALANLAVMTIIEVYNNLKNATTASKSRRGSNQDKTRLFASSNGIKLEPTEQPAAGANSGLQQQQQRNVDGDEASATAAAAAALNGPRDAKRIRLTGQDEGSATAVRRASGEERGSANLLSVSERLDRFNQLTKDLMRLFRQILADPVMSQRTLFPILFLQQTVVCAREGAAMITNHLQPEISLDIINLFSSELTFEIVIAMSNLSTTHSRRFAAKAMCKLAQIKESKQGHRHHLHGGLYGSDRSIGVSPSRAAAAATSTAASGPVAATSNPVGGGSAGGGGGGGSVGGVGGGQQMSLAMK